MRKLSLFLLVLSVCFGIINGASTTAFAEGSVQMGLTQPLYETGSALFYTYTVSEISVDILTSGEVINVSLAGWEETDQVSVKIIDPSGTERANQVLDESSGKVAIDAAFDGPLSAPYRFTTDSAGVWKVHVLNDTQTDKHNQMLRRFDISVTANASENPDPRIAAGRVYSDIWAFYTYSYAETEASNADLYILVPGGYADTDYVWRLDLNNFSGNYYELTANALGVDSPYSGYSISTSSGSVTKKYPIYLGYPVIANPPPTNPAQLSAIRFIDNAGVDNSISPSDTPGTQDNGYFEFSSNVAGTYAVTVDTNQDGVYGGGDKLLLGDAVAGANQVEWDGTDAAGTVVPNGTYTAQFVVRLGEYHFIANDAETSGGPSADGLTVCQAYPGGAIAEDTVVFWDDQTYLSGTTTLPDGALCSESAGRHTWGNFNRYGFGDGTYIDTYVFGKTTSAEILGVIVTSDDTTVNSPIVDLNGSAAGIDFAAAFTAEGGAIAIADNGATITDSDSTNMSGAIISLSNPQDGDALSLSGALPSGITQDAASTAQTIILTGTAATAEYASAIRLAQFNNTLANPALDTRTVTVTATDDAGHDSNPALSSIAVTDSSLPEISVSQETATLERGDTYTFGDVGTPSVTRDFTIKNLGTGTLHLTGNPYVKISGAHADEFIVESQPASEVEAGSPETFTIRFAPGASGPRSAAVTIGNDDSDRHPYSFALTGNGTAAPDINLKQGTTDIADGGGYTFGYQNAGSDTDVTFTIENTGSGDLVLSGSPLLGISGTDADQFSVQQQPLSSLLTQNGTTSFIIRFSPTSNAFTSAALTIRSNDADESGYLLNLYGNAPAPTVDTPTSTNISTETATLGGTVSDTGGPNVTERGVYWSTNDGFTPPGEGTKASDTGDWDETGPFTVNVDGLPDDTTVYFIAFAESVAGTGYSAQASLTTRTAPSCSNTPFSHPESGTYPANDLQTWTICPYTGGDPVTITFTRMDIETSDSGCYDYVEIFNGSDTAATSLGSYCSEADGDGGSPSDSTRDLALHNTFTSSDASGCLTVQFNSDSYTQETGFTFEIDCGTLPQYSLTVTKAGQGTGTVTSSPAGIACGETCSSDFDGNTPVTLTATPDTGSSFSVWSGDCSGSGACTVTMDAAKSVTATFIAPDIRVTRAGRDIPNGSGTSLYCAGACSTSTPATFRIENNGDANLTLTGGIVLSNETTFSATAPAKSMLIPADYTEFTIQFTNPGDEVPRLTTVTIANDDPDENPYIFKVVGNPYHLLWTR